MRLRREKEDLDNNYQNIFRLRVVDEEKHMWHIDFEGADESIYKGEKYTL